MDVQVTATLRIGDVEFGPEDAALLRAVEEEGSLHGAAGALGRSYSRAHARLRELEDATGPLLDRERGGSGGGGSELTADTRDLLARFERLTAALRGTAGTPETVLAGTVIERTGDLGVVETAAGRVRARLTGSGESVQIALRADAITLHDPAAAPRADDTSARNRISGTVAAVESQGAIAEVRVDTGAEADLVALLTVDSVERLGLAPGADVVASFKATATRATPAETGAGSTDDGATSE